MVMELDFSNIQDLESMHLLLKEKFGFPDFYGKNVNALIDCLTSLRHPEDYMTTIVLEKDEILILRIKSINFKYSIIINHLFISICDVNQRYESSGNTPPIHLVLI